MRSSQIELLKILIFYFLIGKYNASIFLTFGEKSVRDEHYRLKSSNVHRGLIISYTLAQRNEICQDFLSLQLYMNSDAATNMNTNIPIQIAHRWLTQEEVNTRVEKQEDVKGEFVFDEAGIILVCVATGLQTRRPPKALNYISSTFRTKWFYVTQTYRASGAPLSQYVTNFVVLSPDQVTFNQVELEKRYWNTRKIIETLREESPKYAELIEKRDNLSTLSKKQKLNICACILSSQAYRQDRLEYSLDWIKEINEEEAVVLGYEEIQISSNRSREELKTESILCKAFENGVDPKSPSTNMYLTRSYADGYSMIVLKEQSRGIFVDKYFENIAELIIAQEDMNYDKLILNLPQISS